MKIKLGARMATFIREVRALSQKLDRTNDLPTLRAVVLDLRPGDRIVLSTPDRLTLEAVTRIREQWRRYCEIAGLVEIPAIVLEGGMTISVIRQEIAPIDGRPS